MNRVRDAWTDGAPHFSAPFVARPVATTLITLGLALAGVLAYFQLPVAPLPQVEFPTISVQANLPGPAQRPWPPLWPRPWSGRWARLQG
jgi:multidrug efflux pump